MKIVLLTIALFSGSACFAQIGKPVKELPSTVVGKVSPMGAFIAQLSYTINPDGDKDTVYTIRFRNYRYKVISETFQVQFSGEGGSLDSLYSLMKSVFAEENKNNKDYSVSVTLGKEIIALSNYRTLGTTLVMFQTQDGYGLLKESQVEKLFVKN